MMRRILLALCVFSLAFVTFGEEVSLKAVGEGGTFRAAVLEALSNALEMKYGVSVSSTEKAQFKADSSAAWSLTDEQAQAQQQDQLKKSIEKVSHGRIVGYEVLTKNVDEKGKMTVEILARFPARYVVGLDPNLRPRLAVVEFRPYGKTFTWRGTESSTVEWVKSLADKINIRLTKSRMFTMLDRKFVAEANDELAMLSNADCAPAEIVRKCQKLATDYLVVGEVRFYPVAKPAINPLTGKVLAPGSQLFAEVTYRVILAPTGQLKFTDSIRINAGSFTSASIGEFVSDTAEAAAAMIQDGILANYLPRTPETDGMIEAGGAVDTVRQTPVLPVVEPPTPIITVPNKGGGVALPF